MRIIVTCGPSYEPLDQIRRPTNFSTGRLGVTLANYLTRAGHEVVCFKGELASYSGPHEAARQESFSTNDDLACRLEDLARSLRFDAVFHAAALCDYQVGSISGSDGQGVRAPKIASRTGSLNLRLVPATKVLPQRRDWFPDVRIVGWKYELSGTSTDAFAKAWRQINESRTDGCVLNGSAYGDGFAFCHPSGHVQTFDHGWSPAIWISSGWDEPGAQTTRSEVFQRTLAARSLASLHALRRMHRSHQPETGPYSICMHRHDAATVNYTEVQVPDRHGRIYYQSGPPCCHECRGVGQVMKRTDLPRP